MSILCPGHSYSSEYTEAIINSTRSYLRDQIGRSPDCSEEISSVLDILDYHSRVLIAEKEIEKKRSIGPLSHRKILKIMKKHGV